MSSKDCQEEEAEINQSGQGIRSNGVHCTESNLPQIQSVGLNNDEVSSSGDEFPAKIRKPYTITKQRERWTEEEHQKFLEALKLHGRAWRKIEEHIGTKTAVQIRSHAQKFFSKLEREALAKGVPVGKTQDIDIPPPRPKRKPSHPYPRKAGVCIQSSPTINEEENKSPPRVSSIPNELSVGLDLSSPARKSTAFSPYTGKTESPKGVDNSEVKKQELFSTAIFPSGLKLFGQTVVVPSDKSETNSEMKDASPPEVQVSKEVSFQEVNNVQKSKAESINDGQYVDPDLKLQIHLQSTNTDGSNMLEGSGESNTNLASMENNIFESLLEVNHSVCHSGNNPCSSFSVPRPVPVMFVEGTTMERETLKTGLSITSLAHDFAAFNTLTSAGSSSNASDKVTADFQASAVPNFLLPFSGVAGASNPAVHSPEKFPNIHGFLTHCSPPNCPIPSWPFAPSSTLHHPAYAAATLAAAAFWPGLVPGLSPVDLSQRSESPTGQYVSEDANTLATVTAATVAAASAWWSLHGPIPPPFLHPGVYGPVVAAMAAEAASVAAVTGKTPHLSKVGGGCKADMKGHRISTKGEDCMQAKPDGCAQVNGVALKGSKSGICHSATGDSLTQNSPSISEHNATSYIEESCDVDITELEKEKFRKQEMDNNVLDFKSPAEKEAHRNPSKDRSSSGSNTPESETDPILRNNTGMGKEAGEKHCDFDGLGTGSSDVIEACVSDRNKGQSTVPQNDVNKSDARTIRCHGHGDVIGRRAKPGGHSGDIWKSVSEEGRLAFQALFDQDVLPQSFSPRNKSNAEEPMQKDDIQSSASDVCQRSGGIELQDGAKVTSINHDFIGSNGMWREPTFSFYENNSQVPEATASDCSLECLIDSGRNSPINDTTTSDCKQDNQSKISGNGNMRPGRAFVPYRRCSIEAKKDRLHSCPTQNCQEGAREEKRICLKQEVEEG